MTHYVPAYAERNGIRERAICSAYVLGDRHALEPSCPTCRALIAAEEKTPQPVGRTIEVEGR